MEDDSLQRSVDTLRALVAYRGDRDDQHKLEELIEIASEWRFIKALVSDREECGTFAKVEGLTRDIERLLRAVGADTVAAAMWKLDADY